MCCSPVRGFNRQPCWQKPMNGGGKRLVGYVVTEDHLDRSGVVTWLKTHLPDYMVPNVLIAMEKMPVTANGKIDRKALPEPEAELMAQQKYTAPRTVSEQILADTWQKLLQVGRVGIHDNFFELGGHSLLAIRLVYLLNKNQQRELTIGDVSFIRRWLAFRRLSIAALQEARLGRHQISNTLFL